jgi:CheY-like chemotaxis protein
MSRILVIDDDPVSRDILRNLLEEAGHDVVEAATSEDGIVLYKETGFDLVVSDLYMPEKGGLDVIGKLVGADPDARVIAVSGIDLREKLDIFKLAKQLGALQTLSKPIEPGVFLEAVSSALGEQEPGQTG